MLAVWTPLDEWRTQINQLGKKHTQNENVSLFSFVLSKYQKLHTASQFQSKWSLPSSETECFIIVPPWLMWGSGIFPVAHWTCDTWVSVQLLVLLRIRSGVLVRSISSFSVGFGAGAGRSRRRTWGESTPTIQFHDLSSSMTWIQTGGVTHTASASEFPKCAELLHLSTLERCFGLKDSHSADINTKQRQRLLIVM